MQSLFLPVGSATDKEHSDSTLDPGVQVYCTNRPTQTPHITDNDFSTKNQAPGVVRGKSLINHSGLPVTQRAAETSMHDG